MTVTALGSLSVGVAVPGCATAVVAGTTGITAGLSDLLARLTALQAFVPQPFSFTAQLDIATKTLASVQASIAAHLPEPSIADQLAQIAALIAQLASIVGSMQAQLAIITHLQTQLTTAGISAYAFDGPRSALGSELQAAIGPGTPHANALLLVTTDPGAWASLSVVMKVS
jgi:hypothetical protein